MRFVSYRVVSKCDLARNDADAESFRRLANHEAGARLRRMRSGATPNADGSMPGRASHSLAAAAVFTIRLGTSYLDHIYTDAALSVGEGRCHYRADVVSSLPALLEEVFTGSQARREHSPISTRQIPTRCRRW